MTARLRQAIWGLLAHSEYRQRERSGEKEDRFYVVPVWAFNDLKAAFDAVQEVQQESGAD